MDKSLVDQRAVVRARATECNVDNLFVVHSYFDEIAELEVWKQGVRGITGKHRLPW
jgi:hypothetical protein